MTSKNMMMLPKYVFQLFSRPFNSIILLKGFDVVWILKGKQFLRTTDCVFHKNCVQLLSKPLKILKNIGSNWMNVSNSFSDRFCKIKFIKILFKYSEEL